MTEAQAEDLTNLLDEVCEFDVDDIVESRVAATTTATAYPGSDPGAVRLIVVERVVRACRAGPQLAYCVTAWTRDGRKAADANMIGEGELRRSEPFALPAPREEE